MAEPRRRRGLELRNEVEEAACEVDGDAVFVELVLAEQTNAGCFKRLVA